VAIKKGGDATVIRIIPLFRGGLWHPALPGCQDVSGPNPSVFLDSGVKLGGFFDFLVLWVRKTNFFSIFDPVEGFDCLQPQ